METCFLANISGRFPALIFIPDSGSFLFPKYAEDGELHIAIKVLEKLEVYDRWAIDFFLVDLDSLKTTEFCLTTLVFKVTHEDHNNHQHQRVVGRLRVPSHVR